MAMYPKKRKKIPAEPVEAKAPVEKKTPKPEEKKETITDKVKSRLRKKKK